MRAPATTSGPWIRTGTSSPSAATRGAAASPTTCSAAPACVRRSGARRGWRRRCACAWTRRRARVGNHDPAVLARAVGYLYTKETRSSFAIEGETPTASRAERFVAALRAAPDFDPADKAAPVRLQSDIVDRRYAASDWRRFQDFVGATVGGYREEVHFICPRPEDMPRPHGWLDGHDAARRRRRRRPRRGGGGLRLRLRLHPPVRGRERPYPPLPDASRARQERLQPARRDLPDIGGHSARPARLRCGTRDLLAAALRVHPLALDFRPGDRRRERDVRSLPLFRRDRVRRIPVRPRGRHHAPGSRGRARLHRGLRPGVRGGARDRGHAGPPGLPVRAPLHAERGEAFRGRAPRLSRVGGRGGRGDGGGRPGSRARVRPALRSLDSGGGAGDHPAVHRREARP